MQTIIHKRTLMRPEADPELCTGCGTCIDQCPVTALSMVDNIPQVDADSCITCFCCQEICPEKAITLK
jgi:ferredoxin